MKLRIVKCELLHNKGKWKIQQHSFLWGWEYSSGIYDSFEEAEKALNSMITK